MPPPSAPQQLVVLDQDAPADDDRFERVERVQTLQAGTYWRYSGTEGRPEADDRLAAIRTWMTAWGTDRATPVGLVLLLSQIDLIDGRPHTVHLSAHPLTRQQWTSHHYLIDDFLANWQYAPDGEAVRDRELASLQMEVAAIQTELLEGQTNPVLMAPAIEQAVSDWEKGKQKEATASGVPLSTSTALGRTTHGQAKSTSVSDVLSNRMTADQIAELGLVAERQIVIAETTSKWLTTRVEAIAGKIAGMTPFFKERAEVALARTADVRKYAADLMSGIQSLDLYILKGVEIETIATGEDAAPDEPLTLMQAKVFMDEELAAWADVGAEFDYTNEKLFIEQLAANPSLRDQIFPAERCVVSMATRRNAVNYGEMRAVAASAKNQINKSVFLLVRNGENIHRVFSAEKSHEATPRLFPTSAEIDGIFQGFDGSKINFDSLKFTAKHKEAEDVALHYKRFLILLCGLDHTREEGSLFGRFYDEAQSLSFISLEFQQRHMRFVANDDPSSMLPGMEPRPTVREFIAAKNAYLQSGSRVLAYYANTLTSASAPSTRKLIEGKTYDYDEALADPEDATRHKIDAGTHVAYRDGAEICVDVKVMRRGSWRDYAQPTFNARVSLTALKENQDFAYLCLDAVKAAELGWYIHDRRSRVHHVEFIRIFKRTVEALRTEEITESESRTWLLSAVTDAELADTPAERANLVDDSVRAWRAANRGAALPLLADKKAFDTILSHIHSLAVKTEDYVAMLGRYAIDRGDVPLRATLTGKNRLALYVEVPAADRDERLCGFRWVKRISLSVTKTKLAESSSRMAWLSTAGDAKETELHAWPEMAAWVNAEPEPFTYRAMMTALAVVDTSVPRMQEICGNEDEGIDEARFRAMLATMHATMRSGARHYVGDAPLSVPIGAFVHRHSGEKKEVSIRYVVATMHTVDWLRHAGDSIQKKEAIRAYRSIFVDPDKPQVNEKTTRSFEPLIGVQISAHPEQPYNQEPLDESPGWIEVAEWHERLVDGDTRQRGTIEVPSKLNKHWKETLGTPVKRTPNDLLTFLMHDKQTDHQREKSRRYYGGYGKPFPPHIYLNPAVYDGERGTIEEAFLMKVAPRPCVTPDVPAEDGPFVAEAASIFFPPSWRSNSDTTDEAIDNGDEDADSSSVDALNPSS